MTDLKGELASLRIDREQPARSPWRWPLLLLRPRACWCSAASTSCAPASRFARPEVETVQRAR